MSISAVQARTAELDAMLTSLRGTPRTTQTRALGGATTSFAEALRTAAPGTTRSEGLGGAGALAQARGTSAATAAGPAGPTDGSLGEQAVGLARRHLGTPYVWGGETPAGFDCSGLIQYVYKQLGVDLPRVSADQAKVGREVSPAEARPGDLVYFARTGRPNHIGIYAGDGTWVVAPKTGDVVKVQKVDLEAATTIRRVTPEPAVGALRRSAAPGAAPASVAAPAWAAALPPAARAHLPALQRAAESTGTDPRLLAAVAWQESGFRASARSSAGALGLMQIMPATAAGLGVDPLDPEQALQGGGRYLAEQMDRFGRLDLALAAYNAGPGAVRKHGGIPPYEETQKYVTTVLDRFRTLGGRA